MGLTFAKSVKFGAVRFNFSGGGIGMSVGIPGLRIGTGPRGAYIGGGAGGFRYRKSLGKGSSPSPVPSSPSQLPVSDPAAPVPNIVSTVEHEAASVLSLADASGDALIQSMNEQRQKADRWPLGLVAVLVVLWFLANGGRQWPAYLLPGVLLVGLVFVLWLRWRDKLRKLTVLFFEPDEQTLEYFQAIRQAAESVASCRRLQAVAATSQYADTKYSGGASSGLKLMPSTCRVGQPSGVVANLDVPVVQAAKTTLAFYPDKILAFRGKSVGAIEYGDLEVANAPVKFVEAGSVPSDATVVGQTWQYVNKSGGPDKRFKNNRQMPLCRYNELHLTTNRGLDIYLMCSRDGGFDELVRALQARKSLASTQT